MTLSFPTTRLSNSIYPSKAPVTLITPIAFSLLKRVSPLATLPQDSAASRARPRSSLESTALEDRVYRGYIERMDKKMETPGPVEGIYGVI